MSRGSCASSKSLVILPERAGYIPLRWLLKRCRRGLTKPSYSRRVSVFFDCVEHNCIDQVKSLVREWKSFLRERDQHGRTPLGVACELGHLKISKWFQLTALLSTFGPEEER